MSMTLITDDQLVLRSVVSVVAAGEVVRAIMQVGRKTMSFNVTIL